MLHTKFTKTNIERLLKTTFEEEQTECDDRVATIYLKNNISLYYIPLCNGESYELTELTNDELNITVSNMTHLQKLNEIGFD